MYACARAHAQPEQLPLLSRLRQEAAQLRARQSHLSTAQTDVLGLRMHLHRMRRLLSLVVRREKLKSQIAALHQAHFEACAKQRKTSLGLSSVSSFTALPRTVSGTSLAGGSSVSVNSPEKREAKSEAKGGDAAMEDSGNRRSGRQPKDREKFEL